MTQTGIWERFDFGRMAEDAGRERDRLMGIIRRGRESFMDWDQGNRRYYAMYLEQRRNAMEFQRRARERGAYGA